MNPDVFFEKFEHFANAPEAVPKLRDLIVSLGVTGNLVPQAKGDEPASMLLAAARIQRSSLVAAKKIRARKAAPVAASEQPFEAPAGWAWSRLCEVGYELGQKVPDKRFTYIDVGSIDSDKGRISDGVARLEPQDAPSRARKILARGTVIYATVRPYLRNIAIVDREFDLEPIASTAFGILHPFAGINNRYLFYWLRGAPFNAYVQAGMKGMSYPAINDETFYSGYIALPPLAEQARIVAKLDELMAACDRLEAQLKERETRHEALARASLARFSEAPTPANLDFLFHHSYGIPPAELRKAVLALAVQGKLVPQDKREGTGRESLSALPRMAAKVAPPPEVPFQVPETWTIARLGQIYDTSLYGPRFAKEDYVQEGGVPTVRTTDMNSKGEIILRDPPHVRVDDPKKLAVYGLQENDLLVTRSGTIGMMAVFRGPYVAIPSAYLIRFRFPPSVSADFYYLYLRSEYGTDLLGLSLRSIGVPNVNATSMSMFPAPVPPLAEQLRIVAKAKHLLALVDTLETQLAQGRATEAKLLEAALAGLGQGGRPA